MSIPSVSKLPRHLSLCAATVACLGFAGCASIVDGHNQSLSVTTRKDGVELSGAKCSLFNDKGIWYVTTPGSVTVHRSMSDMTVSCDLTGAPSGLAVVKSSTKGMAFGNILAGGLIGAGVDVATGAAYDYPELIVIAMGQTVAPSQPAAVPTAKGVFVRSMVLEVPPGSESAVRSHASWDSNCGGRTPPAITWLQAPHAGRVSVRNEPVTVSSSWDGSTQCLGKQMAGLRVYYQPGDGFHGQDTMVYRAQSVNTIAEVHVTLNVQ